MIKRCIDKKYKQRNLIFVKNIQIDKKCKLKSFTRNIYAIWLNNKD